MIKMYLSMHEYSCLSHLRDRNWPYLEVEEGALAGVALPHPPPVWRFSGRPMQWRAA